MPQADVYYLVEFENPEATTGKELMIVGLDPQASLKNILKGLLASRSQLVIDVEKAHPRYATRHEAQLASDAKKAEWEAMNPERVGAAQQFPDAPNRILDAGKPAV